LKSKKFPTNPKIARQEVITDQSDPRMIEFRKQRGEFEPGYHKGNTIKLQITEYEAGPDEFEVKETIGFNEGAPSLFQIPFFREIAEEAIFKVNAEYEREIWAKELHINFRDYRRRDRKAVVELWKACQLIQPWEEPEKHINRRIKVHEDLFLVGTIEDKIVGTVMGRCDENRGWVEYLAVHPLFRRKGIGRQLLNIIEERLSVKGCFGMGLLIQQETPVATNFYQRVGYRIKNVTYLEKRLRDDY
jgi:ribosomal protein S18 acetylase RimI-like enzyme